MIYSGELVYLRTRLPAKVFEDEGLTNVGPSPSQDLGHRWFDAEPMDHGNETKEIVANELG